MYSPITCGKSHRHKHNPIAYNTVEEGSPKNQMPCSRQGEAAGHTRSSPSLEWMTLTFQQTVAPGLATRRPVITRTWPNRTGLSVLTLVPCLPSALHSASPCWPVLSGPPPAIQGWPPQGRLSLSLLPHQGSGCSRKAAPWWPPDSAAPSSRDFRSQHCTSPWFLPHSLLPK